MEKLLIMSGHEWNQIKIENESGSNWYNYDITNDPDIINDNSLIILENDEEFYKKNIPLKWEQTEQCPKNIKKELIDSAGIKRTIKENSIGKLVENQQFILEGQYSGKKIIREDIKSILNSLSLSEMTYVTDILKQVMKQVQSEKEGFAL